MKIFGIEGNYNTAACTRQGDGTGADVPMLFTKCDTALLKDSKPFFIPDHLGTITAAVHLVVRICRLGKTIAPRFATRYYDAVTLGVDFTATDLQKNLQKAGQPWDLSKSFDGSAAIGTWVSLDELKPVHNLPFTLSCNNTSLQAGYSGDMRHNINDLIAYISQFFTLKTGDLLFTGAPVSPNIVHINDHLEGFIGERKVLSFNCK